MALLVLAGAIALAVLGSYIPFAIQVSAIRHFRSTGLGWSFPSQVYSDWLEFTPGRPLPHDYLIAELEARGYTEAGGAPLRPGEFHDAWDDVAVNLAGFAYPDGVAPAELVHLVLRAGRLAEVKRAGHPPLPPRLEPVLLGRWIGPALEDRTWVPLSEVPTVVRNAVVASEDRRFYQHVGLDFRGLARAVFRDMRGGGMHQGGSTITQQLARSLFLNRRRTMERKVREAFLAFGLEMRLSKDQILEMYLNSVYLGHRDGTGVAGVQEAARYYFDKPVSRLTLPEAATLAGVIPAPNLYSPHTHPDNALRRRNLVLDNMAEEHFISPAEAAEAKRQPLEVKMGDVPATRFGYFSDYARDWLKNSVKGLDPETQGLRVFTTADPVWQERAEEEIKNALQSMDASGDLQGAFCAADPYTGAVRVAVGGMEYSQSPFNRVFQSKRQPGSAFKPVVYSAAYDLNGGHSPYTPATCMPGLQRVFKGGDQDWKPRNYEGEYSDSVTLGKALSKSLNVPTAELVERITAKRVADYSERFGLGRPPAVPSIGLGIGDVTLAQLLGVITTIRSDGRRVPLNPVRAVQDLDGKVVYTPPVSRDQVLQPLTAHLMLEQLRTVVTFGTAYSLRGQFGFHWPAMGKTGTTNDENDAWFIGSTAGLAAGAWVGYDQPRSIHRSGTQAAIPTWARIMTRLLDGFPAEEFPQHPEELEMATFDAYTGGLPNATCLHLIRTAFVKGSAPTTLCPVMHPPELPDSLRADSTAVPPAEEPDQPGGEEIVP